jgi:hypothetical protein
MIQNATAELLTIFVTHFSNHFIWKQKIFCTLEILTQHLFYQHFTVVLTLFEYKYIRMWGYVVGLHHTNL